jgi:hypothetical protein
MAIPIMDKDCTLRKEQNSIITVTYAAKQIDVRDTEWALLEW